MSLASSTFMVLVDPGKIYNHDRPALTFVRKVCLVNKMLRLMNGTAVVDQLTRVKKMICKRFHGVISRQLAQSIGQIFAFAPELTHHLDSLIDIIKQKGGYGFLCCVSCRESTFVFQRPLQNYSFKLPISFLSSHATLKATFKNQ